MKIHRNILGIDITSHTKIEVLENIKKYITSRHEFCHVVSLNPENLVLSREDAEFKEIVRTAQIKIIDGIGVVAAAQMLDMPVGDRITGVDLMDELLRLANENSLSVLLIGGSGNLAKELADCYKAKHGQIRIQGIQGFKDIEKPTDRESEEIFSIVTATRPCLIFAAFGSPAQEKWFYRNRASLQSIVCIGVGGAFNYLSGRMQRPPLLIRTLGLEWLYRLVLQPWRWRRQLRLVRFVWLVTLQRFGLLE